VQESNITSAKLNFHSVYSTGVSVYQTTGIIFSCSFSEY